DATNVQPEARDPLLKLARNYHCLPIAIVFHLPEWICRERNSQRPDRQFGPHVIRRQQQDLRRSLRQLAEEGFNRIYVLRSEEEVAAVTIERQRLWNNRQEEHGPFDVIGDVHGCLDELIELLAKLGYAVSERGDGYQVQPPAGRKAIFLGDLVDRGPKIPQVLRLVMGMVAAGTALCLPGNHDVKFLRALKGKNVQVTHGLAASLAQMEQESAEFRQQVITFLDGLVAHFVLDDGRLVVAHAGLKAEMQGRASAAVREFALYGETTGETDEFGLPVRHNWAASYRGEAMVVYGHTPVPQAEWLNRTINIDTGCVFGGVLTALRYPEQALVSVPAHSTYTEPVRPFLPAATPSLTAQQQHDDVLDIEDVLGKRIISTRLRPNITIREENATAALEVMSRFAVDPQWLIYLPPTMAPSETSGRPELLEHPDEAFGYYRTKGVPTVVCEEKHMGSRAVVVLCRDEETARTRFGVKQATLGQCYTRTGRRFFDDSALEASLLARLGQAAERAGLWSELHSDWLCLDCELMPWSAKAQELLQRQYAAVGAAAGAALSLAVSALAAASAHSDQATPLLERYQARQRRAAQFVTTYRHYCWPVQSLADLKLAPFHLLASEGAVHANQDHLWHLDKLARLCRADEELLLATSYRPVDVTAPTSQAEAIRWWHELTDGGGEGMVVKPLNLVTIAQGELIQPAVKCRGREYLRLIYGPEYTAPANLARLRQRGTSAKRSLALREFALGIEALERFVRREPLRRVHECVFGVLALESEPVDPRL
ncbi:MAG: polynucleotide kinase-phosphatase, partial [Chloroflexota bacterium]